MEQCEICCGRKEIVLPRIKEPAIFKDGDPIITAEIMAKRYPCPECCANEMGYMVIKKTVRVSQEAMKRERLNLMSMANRDVERQIFKDITDNQYIDFYLNNSCLEEKKVSGYLVVAAKSTQNMAIQLHQIHVRQEAFELLDEARARVSREVTNWNSHYETGSISKDKVLSILEDVICRIKAEEVVSSHDQSRT